MSQVLRRKHVLKEMMKDDFELPTEDQQIVHVLSSRGNNLHEVETASAETFLVSMPNKFRKNIWIKRGSYVLVDPIKEGHKVKGEICKILTPEHIKEYIKHGVWPKEFNKKRDDEQVDIDCDENGEDFLMKNPNRPPNEAESSTDEDDDSSETSSDADDDSSETSSDEDEK